MRQRNTEKNYVERLNIWATNNISNTNIINISRQRVLENIISDVCFSQAAEEEYDYDEIGDN